MDADLATDPSEFEKLIDEIVNNDIVIGSRIIRGTLPPIKRPFYRTIFSHSYSKFFRMLFRIQIYDPQCGFKLFRKEVIPKLFSKFSRATNANKTNIRGTGLGLFIAKEVVVAHKGKIWVESEGDGKGSQFIVELPVK